jgi:hypothetical protein
MRNNVTIMMGVMALSAVALFAQGSSQSFSGTVSDSMCGAQHMMKNATPAECTRECVKRGSDFALVSGAKVYTLKGDKAQLDKYAGQKVTVKGQASGDTITVTSVAPAKS